MCMPNSTVSSASGGLPKVLQTLLSRRERVQLHRRDVEILHGLQANVQDRPSAYRILSHSCCHTGIGMRCDVSTAFKAMFSEKKALNGSYNSKHPFLLAGSHTSPCWVRSS